MLGSRDGAGVKREMGWPLVLSRQPESGHLCWGKGVSGYVGAQRACGAAARAASRAGGAPA